MRNYERSYTLHPLHHLLSLRLHLQSISIAITTTQQDLVWVTACRESIPSLPINSTIDTKRNQLPDLILPYLLTRQYLRSKDGYSHPSMDGSSFLRLHLIMDTLQSHHPRLWLRAIRTRRLTRPLTPMFR